MVSVYGASHWEKESGRTVLIERGARERLNPGPPLLEMQLRNYGQLTVGSRCILSFDAPQGEGIGKIH